MSSDDARLAAALIVLRDQLGPVVDEITFQELSDEDRRQLGRAFRRVADDLDPALLVPGEIDDIGDSGGR